MPTTSGNRGALCVVVALVLGVPGCSDAGRRGSVPTPSISAGPWAAEFASAFEDSKSTYERGVLSDGRVTAQELEDAHEKIDRCLRDSELTISYSADGGFEVGSTVGRSPSNDMGKTNRILEACEAEFDQSITFMFEQTRRNPKKLDDAEITVPCLRKAGLVGPDYTERQWRKDYGADTLPFDSMGEQAKQCDLDPLGLWREP